MKVMKTQTCLGMVALLVFTISIAGCGSYSGSNMNTGQPKPTFLYTVNSDDATVSGFTVNPTNGALTSTGTAVAAGHNPEYPTASPNGKFLYVANTAITSNSISSYSIDQTTGVLTPTTPPTAKITNDSEPLGITV